jgi:hypothetical protein
MLEASSSSATTAVLRMAVVLAVALAVPLLAALAERVAAERTAVPIPVLIRSELPEAIR